MTDVANITNKRLSNEQLLDTVRTKAAQERHLTVEVLELLQEVADRDLYLKMGYNSLLKFCVEELKYSESAAYRRVSVLRLARDVPSVKEDLATGNLTLQAASQAQTFLNQERKYLKKAYTPDQKKALVQDIRNKSSRQVEQLLASKSPELPRPETSRQIQEDKREVRVTVDKELDEKLDRLKSRYSHKNQNPTLAELLELMADELLRRAEPKGSTNLASAPVPKIDATFESDRESGKLSELQSKQEHESNGHQFLHHQSKHHDRYLPQYDAERIECVDLNQMKNHRQAKPAVEEKLRIRHSNPRYISKAKREYILIRDRHQCCYKDEISGRVCGSKHLLEIDHRFPVALGGTNDVDNLRLVCRSHNGLFAKAHSLTRFPSQV